jgi:ParB family chromosome partitioning protein
MSKTIEQRNIPIEWLQRGKFQPRKHFDAEKLQELAHSIQRQGIIEPIIVREIGANQFEIIAGERRWRASQLAGLDSVRCEIRQLCDDDVASMTIIENIQREDLNPIEEAESYQRLIDKFGYLHEEIADEVGKSRTKITNSLRLLKLDKTIQQWIVDGQLSEGHGKTLAGLELNLQRELANKAVSRAWSCRKLEEEIKKAQTPSEKKQNHRDPDLKSIEHALSQHIGCPVKIDFDGTKGELTIDWHNLDILQGVFQKMNFKYE